MTRLTLACTAAWAVAILSEGAATAAPLFLRCDGIAVYVSPYEPTPTRVASQRYYRIDEQQFSRMTPSDVVWAENLCITKGARCSTDEDAFNVRWGKSEATIQINRKSGRVADSASGVEFTGDCTPSADPTKSGEPNKF